MSLEIILVLVIVLGALILFISDALPVDLTAILVMVSLMLSGVISPDEAIAGFSNQATITILGLLIISEGLKNTGAVEELGNIVLRMAGNHSWLTILVVMLVSSVSSGFINTTAVVAVFIPIMFQLSKRTKIAPALLLIPLSFAAMIGGSSTMIGTSTNLLIGSMAIEAGLPEFGIFKPTVIGVIMLVMLMIYMAIVGRRLLHKKEENIEVFDQEVDPKQYLTELSFPVDSDYLDQPVNELRILSRPGITLLSHLNENQNRRRSTSSTKLSLGDSLIIKADVKEIVRLNADQNVRIRSNVISKDRGVAKNEQEKELFEVLITASSNLLDQRIQDIDFSSYYDALPLAVKKKRYQSPEKLMEHKIAFGDILLMSGKSHQADDRARNAWVTIQRFSPEVIKRQLPRQDRMWVSIAIILSVIALAVSGILPIVVSAWVGVAAMFLTGCLTLKRAYDNVEWKVIFLLAGVIPLGTALTSSGADQLLATGLLELTQGHALPFVVATLFLITIGLTGIISNQATAVILFPVAINLAQAMSLSAEPLVMTILFGASSSFITPVGYQTNAMVYGPGNYTFRDFIKVGGPICLLFALMLSFLIPWMYA